MDTMDNARIEKRMGRGAPVRAPVRISQTVFLACGVWLIGLGMYFIAFRPPLLPEDPRFIGSTLAEIRGALPGLERWLARVFGVMGGFMAAAGALTVYLASTAIPARSRGAAAILALAGLLTVVMMSATNFIIDSAFKWLLLAPALSWVAGVACYLRESESDGETAYPRHTEWTMHLNVPVEAAFAYLDDFRKLSAHMENPSGMMIGSRMKIDMDVGEGRAVGAHVWMRGAIMGYPLALEQVVIRREAPLRKAWETLDTELVVIGRYRLGFELSPQGDTSDLRVFIDYALPQRCAWIGRLFGAAYARWCVKRMAVDAAEFFANPPAAQTK